MSSNLHTSKSGKDMDVSAPDPAQDLPQGTDRFSPSLIGRTATTVYGEHGTITGPSLVDSARCTFRPDGDPSVVSPFTPRVSTLTLDAPSTRADVLGIMQCNREATVSERAQAWDALMSFASNAPNVDSRAIGHAADVLCEIVTARIRADRSGS